ncbi:protein decapping 5-like [Coffea arabica]|uniref:Protein decapping 5-like n=1 Tax=Coffea arabica TaxID=13443 RepID=A0A6P6X6B3_COFAR
MAAPGASSVAPMVTDKGKKVETETTDAARGVEAYIGSLISLITKSDIRYEGFLFHLSPQESIIGLRNVKSFGTERQKMDGTQVAPSDRLYEYIYFRGTDIKDLQVISFPHVQSTPTLPDDPAIIQPHHSNPPSTNISLASSSALVGSNPSSNSHLGVNVLPPEGNTAPRRSMELSDSWASVIPLPPVNINGPSMQSYWPGFTGFPGEKSHLQQITYPPQPQGLLLPNSIQQQLPHPSVNASFPGNALNFIELPQNLLPPACFGSVNLISTSPLPSTVQYSHIPLSTLLSNLSSTPMSSNISNALPTDQPLSMEVVDSGSEKEPSLVIASNVNSAVPPSNNQAQSLLGPAPFPLISKFTSSFVGSSTTPHVRGSNVSPAIPGSFWERRPVNALSPHNCTDGNSNLGSPSNHQPSDLQNIEELAIELPKSPARKLYDPASSSHPGSQHHGQVQGRGRGDLIYGDMHLRYQSNRDRMLGRGRGNLPNRAFSHNYQTCRGHPVGRGNPLIGTASYRHQAPRGQGRANAPNAAGPYYRRHGGSPAWGSSEADANFTEDFDFEAMNAKFNKKEIWGLLDKAKQGGSEDNKEDEIGRKGKEAVDESGNGLPKLDNKSAYYKDDFFDSLSCPTLDGESYRGKVSELRKTDDEKIGEILQHRRDHGIQGPYRGGNSQGSYRGRGYYNAGRGHAKAAWSRAT